MRTTLLIGVASMLLGAIGCTAITDTDEGQLGRPGSQEQPDSAGADAGPALLDAGPMQARPDGGLTGEDSRRDGATGDSEDDGSGPQDGGSDSDSEGEDESGDDGDGDDSDDGDEDNTRDTAGFVRCGDSPCSLDRFEGCCLPERGDPYCFGGRDGPPCRCRGVLCEAIPVRCDGPTDCSGGDRCCADTGLAGSAERVACRSTCNRGVTPEPELCEPRDGIACNQGNPCRTDPRTLPTPYRTCQ